jgi:hypothetical protein
MHDSTRPAQFDDLRHQAMLYAAGEMDARAAEDFENNLGTDVDVQQALVQAVHMAGLLDGRSYAPNPAYREVVRASVNKVGLRARRRRVARLWLTGACAAALVGLAVMYLRQREPEQPSSPAQLAKANPELKQPQRALPDVSAAKRDNQPAVVPQQAGPEEKADAVEFEDTLGAAETWAQLSNSERLRKVLEYELRRRMRMRLNPDDFRILRELPFQSIE